MVKMGYRIGIVRDDGQIEWKVGNPMPEKRSSFLTAAQVLALARKKLESKRRKADAAANLPG